MSTTPNINDQYNVDDHDDVDNQPRSRARDPDGDTLNDNNKEDPDDQVDDDEHHDDQAEHVNQDDDDDDDDNQDDDDDDDNQDDDDRLPDLQLCVPPWTAGKLCSPTSFQQRHQFIIFWGASKKVA